MITAIIMAGGSGTRTGQSVPKQFLTVNDIPIVVYTMRKLQDIPEITRLVVVSAAGWESFVCSYAQQFGISKLDKVITGGRTRNETIYNGLCYAAEAGDNQKICLIDANRPLIPEQVITEVIALADQCDCAVAAEPCFDSMFVSKDGQRIAENADRAVLYKGQSPECAHLSVLMELYQSEDAQLDPGLSTSGLAVKCNKKVLVAKGHFKCFKITTADDFELFKALLNTESLDNILKKEIL